MSDTDLPDDYRWATEAETEAYSAHPGDYPDMIVVPRTADCNGVPYTQDEADMAVPIARKLDTIAHRYTK